MGSQNCYDVNVLAVFVANRHNHQFPICSMCTLPLILVKVAVPHISAVCDSHFHDIDALASLNAEGENLEAYSMHCTNVPQPQYQSVLYNAKTKP